ncbi:MAG TPA: MarR family transcriptional regulator [Paracoccaceae bacterium]|nr:MarR family transcriptional regulator [Paracoccaceae bacterium]
MDWAPRTRADDARGSRSTARPERLAHALARVSRRLEEELGLALREARVPIEQFRILEALAERGPATMGSLADAALVERPTLTKIVDRMVAAGLVFRRPDDEDRRRVHVALSDDGAALAGRLGSAARAQERRLASRLGAADAARLRALLDALD